MASFAEAYGFTPREFFSLTLPQIAEYGEFAKRQSEALEESRSKVSSSSGKSSGTSQKINSVEELVARFGEKSTAPKAGE